MLPAQDELAQRPQAALIGAVAQGSHDGVFSNHGDSAAFEVPTRLNGSQQRYSQAFESTTHDPLIPPAPAQKGRHQHGAAGEYGGQIARIGDVRPDVDIPERILVMLEDVGEEQHFGALLRDQPKHCVVVR
jgi:hypothetical protein